MFGENPVRSRSDFTPGVFRVQAIFYTIQGEGPFSGLPAVFVRLAGCNLRCHFCDTDFESGWNNIMTTEDLYRNIEAQANAAQLIVITGGEPFLQDLPALVHMIRRRGGPHAQIETAGTLWQDFDAMALTWATHKDASPLDADYSIVVSPKTPSVHPAIRARALAWKYIVQENGMSDDTGLPNVVTQASHSRGRITNYTLATFPPSTPKASVFIQPMDEDVHNPIASARNRRAAIEVCMKHGYRLCLQTHKIVGLD